MQAYINHQSAANVPTSASKTASTDIYKLLYSGEVITSEIKNYSGTLITEYEFVPSSQRNYTIDDALNYQYNQQFSFNLSDLINGTNQSIRLREPGSAIPKEFIDSLKQNGITENSYDAGRTDFYLQGLDEDTATLDHSVAYLASGYAVSKQHIESYFTGDQKTKALSQLDADFNTAVALLADKNSQELGGFFEENESGSETQKIKDSIITAYHDQVNQYSNFIKNNDDYASLNGTGNDWLKKDDSYMACQLRNAVGTDETVQAKETEKGYYSLDELDKTKSVISEIKSGINSINCYDDEEKIGYKLAEIALKGEVFSKFSGVSESLKNAVSKSINHIVNTITDQLNQQLMKSRESMAEPEKSADLNEKDILSVYNKVLDLYKNTNNMITALKEGAAFAKNQHMSKVKNPQYSNLNRYGNTGSKYWNNFFQNTLNYKTQIISLGKSDSNNGYIDSESGLETLSSEWNRFVSKFTNSQDVMLNKNIFSVYA